MSKILNPQLYDWLGGQDYVAAMANDLLPRFIGDPLLGRSWENRGEDGLHLEKNC
jgi:hemoglobin